MQKPNRTHLHKRAGRIGRKVPTLKVWNPESTDFPYSHRANSPLRVAALHLTVIIASMTLSVMLRRRSLGMYRRQT